MAGERAPKKRAKHEAPSAKELAAAAQLEASLVRHVRCTRACVRFVRVSPALVLTEAPLSPVRRLWPCAGRAGRGCGARGRRGVPRGAGAAGAWRCGCALDL